MSAYWLQGAISKIRKWRPKYLSDIFYHFPCLILFMFYNSFFLVLPQLIYLSLPKLSNSLHESPVSTKLVFLNSKAFHWTLLPLSALYNRLTNHSSLHLSNIYSLASIPNCSYRNGAFSNIDSWQFYNLSTIIFFSCVMRIVIELTS
jgi:hypothetical protein